VNKKQLVRILGLASTVKNFSSSSEEIGAAFRKWAMNGNHPDRGGDTALFSEVSAAVERYTSPKGATCVGCFVRYEGRWVRVVGNRGRYLELANHGNSKERIQVVSRDEVETPIYCPNSANIGLNSGFALVPAHEFYKTEKSSRRRRKLEASL
jgi:hypothetical protein